MSSGQRRMENTTGACRLISRNPDFTRPQFKISFSCLNKKNRPQKIAVKSRVKMIRGLNTTIQAFSVSNSLASNKKRSVAIHPFTVFFKIAYKIDFKQFTVNCFTVTMHPSLLWLVTRFFQNHYNTPCILSFWQLPEDCLLRGMKLRVANKYFWPSSSLRIYSKLW